MSDRSASGRWLVFGAAFFWGTSATLARYVFRDRHVPPLTAVELRLLLAAAMLGPWLAWKRPEALRVDRRDWKYFVILGLFGLAAVQGSYYYSISVLGVGLAILIQYIAPTLVVLYGLTRGEKVSRTTAVALIAALLGTILLVGGVNPASVHARPYQWLISFVSAFAFAFYVIYSKRGLSRYSPETVLFYTFCIAGLFWAIVTPPWNVLGAGYSAGMWGIFVALAIFSTLVPFELFYAGLHRLPVAQAGIVATLEPVIAVLSAALVLRETLNPVQSLGAALVVMASMLATRKPAAPPPAA